MKKYLDLLDLAEGIFKINFDCVLLSSVYCIITTLAKRQYIMKYFYLGLFLALNRDVAPASCCNEVYAYPD